MNYCNFFPADLYFADNKTKKHGMLAQLFTECREVLLAEFSPYRSMYNFLGRFAKKLKLF